MSRRMRLAGMIACVLAARAGAVEWSTNLPCFSGGTYDGWDRGRSATSAPLGDAEVWLRSASDVEFAWTTPRVALEALTIDVQDPGGLITAGGSIRVSVPAAWQCRFDGSATLNYGGSAALKVGAASYSGSGRTLIVPVTTDFDEGDDLVVEGLALRDAHLTSAEQRLELDFDGSGTIDVYDQHVLRSVVSWPGGTYDGWDRCALAEAATIDARLQGTIIFMR